MSKSEKKSKFLNPSSTSNSNLIHASSTNIGPKKPSLDPWPIVNSNDTQMKQSFCANSHAFMLY